MLNVVNLFSSEDDKKAIFEEVTERLSGHKLGTNAVYDLVVITAEFIAALRILRINVVIRSPMRTIPILLSKDRFQLVVLHALCEQYKTYTGGVTIRDIMTDIYAFADSLKIVFVKK